MCSVTVSGDWWVTTKESLREERFYCSAKNRNLPMPYNFYYLKLSLNIAFDL